MKRNFKSLILVIGTLANCLIVKLAHCQTPQAIPYQAVARNNAGTLIANQNIAIRFSVHNITANGTIVYRETQNATTNNLGLFNVYVGQGTPTVGTFASIDWGNGAKFVEVEIDPTGGTSYNNLGTVQLMSVPYALYAGSSGSSSNLANGMAAGNTPYWNGTSWVNNSSNIFNNGANVGIGTIAPEAKLTVTNTNTNVPRGILNEQYSNSSDGPQLALRKARGTLISPSTVLLGDALGALLFYGHDGNGFSSNVSASSAIRSLADENFTSTNHGAHLEFSTVPNGSSFGIEAMRISNNGNVGIGINNPTKKLHVNGEGEFKGGVQIGYLSDVSTGIGGDADRISIRTYNTANSAINFQSYQGNSTFMSINGTNGNVGIGIINPISKLHIKHQAINTVGIQLDSYTGLTPIFTTWQGGSGNGNISLFDSVGIENFRIATSLSANSWINCGNVGIGTTTPSSKLEVAGQLTITGGSPGAGKVLTSDANGLSSWQTPTSNLTKKAKITYQVASGTGGGTGVVNAWGTRPLNTIKYNDIGLTLSTNQINLPAGNYEISTYCVFNNSSFQIGHEKTRVRNITDGSNVAISLNSGSVVPASGSNYPSFINDERFTLTSSSILELQYFIDQGSGANMLGYSYPNPGQTEVYTEVIITQIQ